jgi:hypothetical protein
MNCPVKSYQETQLAPAEILGDSLTFPRVSMEWFHRMLPLDKTNSLE